MSKYSKSSHSETITQINYLWLIGCQEDKERKKCDQLERRKESQCLADEEMSSLKSSSSAAGTGDDVLTLVTCVIVRRTRRGRSVISWRDVKSLSVWLMRRCHLSSLPHQLLVLVMMC